LLLADPLIGTEMLLVLFLDVLRDGNTELHEYGAVKFATFAHFLEGFHDELLLAVGLAADLSPRGEQALLLSLEVLCLQVVVLDLIQDQLFLVLLGSSDTFNIRIFLFTL
jgi:hypothetical protein